MKIVWLTGAARDLEAILERLRAFSDAAAEHLGRAIKHHVGLLADYAHLGQTVPESGIEQIRELVESGFRIWYEVCTDRVEICVVHSRQDFTELGQSGSAPHD